MMKRTVHEIASGKFNSKYDDGLWHSDVRIKVEGLRGGDFGIGYVPPTASGRQVSHGPIVVGPWAYAFGLGIMIDTYGGSAREVEEARAADMLYEVKLGDVLVIDGHDFLVERDHNDNIKLTLVK